METSMLRKLSLREIQDHWIAIENIARFQAKLKFETDAGQRDLLEELIVIEKAKLSQNLLV
jgi:hypothetical protein